MKSPSRTFGGLTARMPVQAARLLAGLAMGLLFQSPAAAQSPNENQAVQAPVALSGNGGPDNASSGVGDPIAIASSSQGDSACDAQVLVRSASHGFKPCPFGDAGMGLTLSIRREADFGTIEAQGYFGRGYEGALAPWRQLAGGVTRGVNEESTLAVAGLKASLLDGRVKLSTTLGESERWLAPIAQSPISRWRRDIERDGARLVRLELAPIQRAGLQWSIGGESSRAGETYGFSQAAMLYRGEFIMPGKRQALTSTLKLRQWRLTASVADHKASFGDSKSIRLALAGHGLSLVVTKRRSHVAETMIPGTIASRTSGSSIYVEADTASLFPSLAFGRRGLKRLVPTMLSLSRLVSRTEPAMTGAGQPYRRDGFELYGNWKSGLGETTLGYSKQSRRGLGVSARNLEDRTFQVSHVIRQGAWRFGIDGLLSRTAMTGPGASRDSALSLGQSLVYSRPGGPELRLRVGQDRMRSRALDGGFSSALNASRITATLDLTPYLRRRLERQDIGLKLEYRRRFDRDDFTFATFEDVLERYTENRARQGLLLSFHMKLR